MTIDQILGWVTVLLDTFGARNAISVVILIIIAGIAFERFISNRG